MQLFINGITGIWLAEEVIYSIKSVIYHLFIAKWEDKPSSEHSGSHRGNSVIDDICEGYSTFMQRTYEFQVSDGEVIQSHKLVSINALNLCDMVNVCMLGVFEVMQYSSCSD